MHAFITQSKNIMTKHIIIKITRSKFFITLGILVF